MSWYSFNFCSESHLRAKQEKCFYFRDKIKALSVISSVYYFILIMFIYFVIARVTSEKTEKVAPLIDKIQFHNLVLGE